MNCILCNNYRNYSDKLVCEFGLMEITGSGIKNVDRVEMTECKEYETLKIKILSKEEIDACN